MKKHGGLVFLVPAGMFEFSGFCGVEKLVFDTLRCGRLLAESDLVLDHQLL